MCTKCAHNFWYKEKHKKMKSTSKLVKVLFSLPMKGLFAETIIWPTLLLTLTILLIIFL